MPNKYSLGICPSFGIIALSLLEGVSNFGLAFRWFSSAFDEDLHSYGKAHVYLQFRELSTAR